MNRFRLAGKEPALPFVAGALLAEVVRSETESLTEMVEAPVETVPTSRPPAVPFWSSTARAAKSQSLEGFDFLIEWIEIMFIPK